MLFYKLHIIPKASEVCTTYNAQVQPEIIADHNDPYRVDWIEGNPKEDVFIGEKVGPFVSDLDDHHGFFFRCLGCLIQRKWDIPSDGHFTLVALTLRIMGKWDNRGC